MYPKVELTKYAFIRLEKLYEKFEQWRHTKITHILFRYPFPFCPGSFELNNALLPSVEKYQVKIVKKVLQSQFSLFMSFLETCHRRVHSVSLLLSRTHDAHHPSSSHFHSLSSSPFSTLLSLRSLQYFHKIEGHDVMTLSSYNCDTCSKIESIGAECGCPHRQRNKGFWIETRP